MKIKKDKSALIVFAREPKDGEVKTRLLKSLSVPVVTQLYQAFIKDVLTIALEANCDERLIYCAATDNITPFLSQFKDRFHLQEQQGIDLGERMFNAANDCRKKGFERIVIIGTDCLTLTTADIVGAFDKLNEHDYVIGPACDGGYYLIGLRNPHQQIFQKIKWSSGAVLRQTRQNIKELKQSVYLLKEQEDVDDLASLKRLHQELFKREFAFSTRKILENLAY